MTIREAAEQLRVSERTLRRLLARPEFAGRAIIEDRQTNTGRRQARVLPTGVISELAAHFEKWETPANGGNENTARTVATPAEDRHVNTGNGGMVIVYERLIAEQQARISDLQTALEHEREQSRRLAEALAREQTLRALIAAAPSVDAQEAVGTRESDADGKAPMPEVKPAEAVAVRPWWRFWERGV